MQHVAFLRLLALRIPNFKLDYQELKCPYLPDSPVGLDSLLPHYLNHSYHLFAQVSWPTFWPCLVSSC